MSNVNDIDVLICCEYEVGFVINIELEIIFLGFSEDVVCIILGKKNEFEWMLEWCLQLYWKWKEMSVLIWVYVKYLFVDFNIISYYFFFKLKKDGFKSLDEVDFEILEIFEKLGIFLYECVKLVGVVVDVVFDSVFIGIIFKDELVKVGVIFCFIFEVIQDYLDLICKYLGSVVLQ